MSAVSKRSLTASRGPSAGRSGRARKIASALTCRATLLRQDELPRDGAAAGAAARERRHGERSRRRERAQRRLRNREAEVVVAEAERPLPERERPEPHVDLAVAAREHDEPEHALLARDAQRLRSV